MSNPKQDFHQVYKEYRHNPPHYFNPGAKYFITASLYKKRGLMKQPEVKRHLLKSFFKACDRHGWRMEDWVILNNHYHVMMQAPVNTESLAELIKEVHKFSALYIKKTIPGTSGFKKIWYNYWDRCIRGERDYYSRLHYIWYNPVKHKYVTTPKDWEHGSYFHRVQAIKGELDEIMKQYPLDLLNVYDDF